jgi:hypothetical protein
MEHKRSLLSLQESVSSLSQMCPSTTSTLLISVLILTPHLYLTRLNILFLPAFNAENCVRFSRDSYMSCSYISLYLITLISRGEKKQPPVTSSLVSPNLVTTFRPRIRPIILVFLGPLFIGVGCFDSSLCSGFHIILSH